MGRIRRVLSDHLWYRIRGLRIEGREDAALLYAYLVTGPAFDFVGAGVFNAAGAAEDLVLSTRRIKAALQVLVSRDLVLHDEPTRVIFVPAILEGDPVRSAAQLAGALRRLDGLPPSSLVDRVKAVCGQGVSPRESPGGSPRPSPQDSLRESPTPSPSPSPSPTLSPSPAPAPHGDGTVSDLPPREVVSREARGTVPSRSTSEDPVPVQEIIEGIRSCLKREGSRPRIGAQA